MSTGGSEPGRDIPRAQDQLFASGRSARQKYAALGGSHGVPVEDFGGPGTALVHWREGVFQNELMTGFAEHVGVPMPLSHVTIGSMADLGYVVDWGEADPYVLAGVRGAPLIEPTEPLGYDTGVPGPVRFLPETLRR